MIYFNIGLAVNGQNNAVPAAHASRTLRDALEDCGIFVHNWHEETQDSVSETTLVAAANLSGQLYRLVQVVERVAALLDQDAIAVYNSANERGGLFGPKANEWGTFSLDHFLMPLEG